MSRLLPITAALVLVAIAGGCGGSGGGPGANSPTCGETVSVGTLQVGVASAAAFKTLTLTSPGASRIAFTVLYGTKIVRLEEMGYGRIAFCSGRDGNSEIYVMNADGSDPTNLTNAGSPEFSPGWSPSGSRIAFGSSRNGNNEVYAMSADGSGQINLTNNHWSDMSPDWSPDGRRIAFQSYRDHNYEVYLMNADGSGPTNVTNNGAEDFGPAWSPDGRRIAFYSERDGNDEIYIMNVDGSGQTNLTNNGADDTSAAWSPDGRKIAFTSRRDGNDEIYVMNADGSGQTNLTNNGADDMSAAWSPDGRKIAFTSRRDGSSPEVYVMNADGSEPTNLTVNGVYDAEPSWCPAPSVVRSLIGAAGTDGGGDPPFGAARPLAIVGLNADGLVSATTIGMNVGNWRTLGVTALRNIGTDLAGVKIKGNNVRQVIEDRGRGLPTRLWEVYGSPTTGAVLIFFNGETGKVSSIIAAADTALAEAPAQLSGGHVVLHGSFTEVYSARDPARNLVSGPATEVALNSRTGEVIAVN